MNITKQQLKQIIQEELSILSEQPAPLDNNRLMGDLNDIMNSIHQFSKRVKSCCGEDIGHIRTPHGTTGIEGVVRNAFADMQQAKDLLQKYFDSMPTSLELDPHHQGKQP